jgi:pimeloyl-ACP methyl ester carboxylesterase
MPDLRIHQMVLHFETSGRGPPLLFIHGLGSTAQDWEPQIQEFSKTHQVIAFDLRGHGQSSKPPDPYSIPLFASDAAELLQALKIESAHVVGLSLGGCVAFQLALDFPSLVRSLVIVNSAPEFVRRSFKTRLEVWRRTASVRWRGLRRMGERMGARLLPRPEHVALRATFVERFAQNDPQAYLNSLKALIGWNVTDRLGSIQCPVLVVASEHDYTPLAFKEKYARRMPAARLVVIPNAHHAVPLEQPEQFNAVLAKFLAAHGLPDQPRA